MWYCLITHADRKKQASAMTMWLLVSAGSMSKMSSPEEQDGTVHVHGFDGRRLGLLLGDSRLASHLIL